MPHGIPMQFFAQQWFTLVCCKFYYFINFNIWKMLKMLKIGFI